MTALPASSDFTGSTRTNAEMKLTHAALRAYLAGLLGEDGTVPTALAALGVPAAAGHVARTTTTTLTAADRGRVITATTGTWTLTLPAAATAGVGWTALIANTGAGVITIARAGSDLIDGATSVVLPAGAAVLVLGTGAAWQTVMLAAGTAAGRLLRSNDLQADAIDATAGRLLTPGAFGLGSPYGPMLADFDATSTPAGLWVFNTATTTVGTSPGFANGAVLILETATTGTVQPVQIALQRSSGLGAMLWRTNSAGTWGAWRSVLARDNILGTVSQSGGQPTGAIMETGSNANGRYYRYADGRQVCEHQVTFASGATTADGALFRSAATNWTFPAAFVGGTPALFGDTETFGYFLNFGGRNTVSTANIRLYATVSSGTSITVRVRAEGRWFA